MPFGSSICRWVTRSSNRISDDPLCQAVQRAVDAGLVVVAAAGNMGKTSDGRPSSAR